MTLRNGTFFSMDTKSVEIVQVDPQTLQGKLFFHVTGEEYRNKGFEPGDILVVDWDKPLEDGCRVVVLSKKVFHIRDIVWEDGAFFIKPEADEFFIPIQVTPKIRKVLSGVIVAVCKRLVV